MSDNILRCSIKAVGGWGQNYTNWQELSELLTTGATAENTASSPKPEIIPANERRRAPLPVKLAVESSWQATQSADLDPKDLACVFVSGLGDTQLTDYMCKVLATENMQLSPTKFHNSVHNAAAGYWTISTGCMKAANSVAGFNESVSLAILEAVTQCVQEQAPVQITFYDAPSSEILKPLLKNDQSFSASLIIEPVLESNQTDSNLLEMQVVSQATEWPELDLETHLDTSYKQNPSARILAVLNMLTKDSTDTVLLPLSAETSLQLTLHNPKLVN
ncbi:beta-ketoacyl synthase chain length factor [Cocleimonas sp. KMM 6892]|uniref:beta-ketoacyl synthase chain length factor n=1 Tax=unclassified Cocleimonas TaxID=2639732 RepID=UPI002DB9F378|nr:MULTISPECIES: beta-ketoacyl synthase chain length factor [unclassified Cocleimonas]MEB8432437.1 beta-ketoacyl synthase chain length factor [Cocleimonas sp. KMM 6892]MEC4715296.1 beta-ketoacyl synthase chain length factor [Cocleimonas sp. KMM 6895]MEC4745085.1 beta-ketoacyl synthase chain length factor [Cocleimonas sp. KMM 6896]